MACAPARTKRMSDWFATSLGSAILAEECEQCRKLLPSAYYPRSLQVGLPMRNFLEGIETGARFFIGESAMRPDSPAASKSKSPAQNKVHCAHAAPTAMPFGDKTHDLIILPHTLDFCPDPHGVLREVNHILVAQGCLVITGFNRFSLWGAIRPLKNKSRAQKNAAWQHSPWTARHQRVGRVQDWLALLGFELVGAAMAGYQPPLQNAKWRNKLTFLDDAGARWWPGLGAVYVIVGRKCEIAISGRNTRGLQWRRLIPGIAQPATSGRVANVINAGEMPGKLPGKLRARGAHNGG